MPPKPSFDFNFANARKDGWSEDVEIFLARKTPTGAMIVSDFIMEAYGEGQVVPRPASINLTKDTARLLMDALWDAGVRPSNQINSVGQLAALQAHLEDMRHLTFKTLSVDKP